MGNEIHLTTDYSKPKVTIDLEEYQDLLGIRKTDIKLDLDLEVVLAKLVKVSILFLRKIEYNVGTSLPTEKNLIEIAKELGYKLELERNTIDKKLEDIQMILIKL